MKRTALILLAFLIILDPVSPALGRASAPGKAFSEPVPAELDFSRSYASVSGERIFAAGDLFYWLSAVPGRSGEYRILYSHRDRMEWYPLCGRPDCLHNDDNCNSFLEGDVSSIFWPYGGYIYYVLTDRDSDSDDPGLWRMRLDGYGHEKVLGISAAAQGLSGTVTEWEWFFHNRYLILEFWFSGASDLGSSGYRTFTVDLGAEKPALKRLDVGERYSFGVPLVGRGDLLYSVLREERMLVCTDLSAGTLERICELPSVPLSASFVGSELYIFDHRDIGSYAAKVDLETGVLSVLNTAEGEYWSRCSEGFAIGTGDPNRGDDACSTRIYGLSGELVQEIPASEMPADVRASAVIGGIVFGFERGSSADAPEWYLDLSEVGTDGLTWRRIGEMGAREFICSLPPY